MFEDISFSFLCGLAFTSWIVLCFWHNVYEENIYNTYNIELYTEDTGYQRGPRFTRTMDPSPISRKNETLKSCILVFAGTIVLVKFFHFLELQLRQYLTKKTLDSAADKVKNEQTESLKISLKEALEDQQQLEKHYREEKARLREQLYALQTRCLELHEVLDELKSVKSNESTNNVVQQIDPTNRSIVDNSFSNSNTNRDSELDEHSSCIPDPANTIFKARVNALPKTNSTYSFMQSTSQMYMPSQNSQNIFISNSFLRINGNFSVAEDNFNHFRRQTMKPPLKQSEFLQVWGQFMQDSRSRPMIGGSRFNSYI